MEHLGLYVGQPTVYMYIVQNKGRKNIAIVYEFTKLFPLKIYAWK